MKKKSEFISAVRAEGVPIDVCYPTPLYKTKLFEQFGDSICPVTEDVTSRIITLFTDPVLGKIDIEQVSEAVRKVSEYYSVK